MWAALISKMVKQARVRQGSKPCVLNVWYLLSLNSKSLSRTFCRFWPLWKADNALCKLFLSSLYQSVSHCEHTLTLSDCSASLSDLSSVEKVVSSSALSRRFGFASQSSETSWFVWQTQMPLNSPQPQLLTSLIPCNALFTSSPANPPTPTYIGKGTATHDYPGRKSIWPWRLCFKWAINRSWSRIYFLSWL